MDVRNTGIAQTPESEERTRSCRQLFYHACIYLPYGPCTDSSLHRNSVNSSPVTLSISRQHPRSNALKVKDLEKKNRKDKSDANR